MSAAPGSEEFFCDTHYAPYPTDAGAMLDSNGEHARGANDQALYYPVAAASSLPVLGLLRQQETLGQLARLSLDPRSPGLDRR